MIGIFVVVVSIVSSAATSYFISNSQSTNDLIKDFYLTENAVHVSPHSLRGMMDKGSENFVLVDVRSKQEYEKEHVIGAINIPAYVDPNTSIKLDSDKEAAQKIVDAFKALPKDKEIITYCYSMPCMTGRKVGKLLAENDVYVKTLNIGWNEWRYFWTLWNHDGEWNSTNVMDYIASGPEPGTPKIRTPSKTCGLGELSC